MIDRREDAAAISKTLGRNYTVCLWSVQDELPHQMITIESVDGDADAIKRINDVKTIFVNSWKNGVSLR
jgi:hypothetical protein